MDRDISNFYGQYGKNGHKRDRMKSVNNRERGHWNAVCSKCGTVATIRRTLVASYGQGGQLRPDCYDTGAWDKPCPGRPAPSEGAEDDEPVFNEQED